MKVSKIKIYDNTDKRQWTDLVLFNHFIELEDIRKTIQDVRDNVEDYTNQDIYDALEREYGRIEVIWLNDDIVEIGY